MNSTRHWFFTLLVLALQALPLLTPSQAQTSKAAEIEIAGPWDYAVDEDQYPNKIIVMAPAQNPPSNQYHQFAIFSGESASMEKGTLLNEDPYPGIYTLDFGVVPKDCPQSKTLGLKLLSVPGIDISKVLSQTDKRIAFILPKPCFFSLVKKVRAAVDTKKIASPEQAEREYAVWLELHYQVDQLSATLTGTSDAKDDKGIHKTTYADTIPFGSNAAPFKRKAIALQLYSPFHKHDNSKCDDHSVKAFDDAIYLYGLKGKYFRQFPDLDNDGSSSQLATYNLNCLQQDFIDVQHELEELNLQVRREIDEFPSDVEKTGAKEAQRQLDKINIDISNLSDKNVPKTLLHIIQEAQKAINNIARGDPKVDAPKHLLAELGLFFGPGKTDCHKMQFNLNNAIKY